MFEEPSLVVEVVAGGGGVLWNYRRAELIKFGWAQINQVALVISGPFLVISDVPLGEFKMGFVLNIPHTLAVPLSFLFEYRPFAFKIMMVACGHIPILSTRVMCVRLKEHPRKTADPSLFCRQRTASRRKRLAVSAFLRRRRCGGLLAPLLAPRALILRTNQRLDALSRPTPPYFGHT